MLNVEPIENAYDARTKWLTRKMQAQKNLARIDGYLKALRKLRRQWNAKLGETLREHAVPK